MASTPTACTATDFSNPTAVIIGSGQDNRHASENKGIPVSVEHKPPSGKLNPETCQCKHQPPLPPATQKAGLTTTQLLFQPTPPCTKKSSHPLSLHVRKIQSANARLVPSTPAGSTKDITLLPKGGVRDRQRPSSVNVPPRHRPGSSVGNRPVPKQFLTFEVSNTKSRPVSGKKDNGNGGLYKMSSSNGKEAEIKRWKERKKKEGEKIERPIPAGISQLRPWLTEDIPVEWCGVDPVSCLVFLPSLLHNVDDVPVVPPVQHPQDVLPHTVIPPPPKPFDPKKFFHYDVEKHIRHDAEYDQRDRSRPRHGIYEQDSTLLHDQEKYSRNRTEEMIRQEIEDLENLLQGIGNANSSNVMAQYQADISRLQWSIKDTLVKCYQIESHFKQEQLNEPSDLLGLRAYIREREEILSQIRARRETCLMELERLESEIGMTTQSEVLKAFKNLHS